MKSDTCKSIKQLFIRQYLEDIPVSEKDKISDHLCSCKECQSYVDTLSAIETNVQVHPGIRPRPDLHRDLLKKLTVKTGFFHELGQTVRSIFAYRVPVYQGLIGIVAVLFLVVMAYQFPGPHKNNAASAGMKEMNHYILNSNINVVSNIDVIAQQNVGMNVKEDTIFTKFIFNPIQSNYDSLSSLYELYYLQIYDRISLLF